MRKLDILICGVGGQGTLLTSRIIGRLAMDHEMDIKLSEVHGMSQRGGSVVTYVRIGEKVLSPIIEEGGADIILAFEELEAMRYLPYLKEDGTIIINSQQMMPMPVITGAAKYPYDALERIREQCKNVIAVDALSLAREAGSIKSANVVLLGVLAGLTQFNTTAWKDAIVSCVPKKTTEVNLKAFELGMGRRK